MALSLQNLPFKGLTVPNAYVRIDRIAGGKRDGNWTAYVRVFASADAAVNQDALYDFNHAVSYQPGMTPEAELYQSLKTRPEFAGVDVTDC